MFFSECSKPYFFNVTHNHTRGLGAYCNALKADHQLFSVDHFPLQLLSWNSSLLISLERNSPKGLYSNSDKSSKLRQQTKWEGMRWEDWDHDNSLVQYYSLFHLVFFLCLGNILYMQREFFKPWFKFRESKFL